MMIINDIILNQNHEDLHEAADISGFFHRIKREGYQVATYCNIEQGIKESDEKAAMVITNIVQHIDAVKNSGLPCIFYEGQEGTSQVYGVDMVVKGLDEVDGSFLTLVYNRHFGIPAIIAETKRLVIRETVPDDTQNLYEVYADPLAVRYLPGLPEDTAEERKILEAYFHHVYGFYGYGMWSVIERESGRMIGRVGLENGTCKGDPIVELGYIIGEKWRRRGYASEAVKAVLKYAEDILELREVYIRVEKENMASCVLAEKCGFTLVQDEDVTVLKKTNKYLTLA